MLKGKDIENKTAGTEMGVKVRVRALLISIYFHFSHFCLSIYDLFFDVIQLNLIRIEFGRFCGDICTLVTFSDAEISPGRFQME